ncbi:MAG: helix-turn-helix domain-containing protein [Rhodospirillaceae bacterium]|jgi:excisionase family DNA binding protein|nr:helix-turn-helix domain-containing protein [Rhodospirillaceae bacterium]
MELTTQPLAYRISDACKIAGVGRSLLYQAIRDGSLQAKKYGRRTLILHGDLESWLSTLPKVGIKL